MTKNHHLTFIYGIILFFLVELFWFYAYFMAPGEAIQGEVYRIMYLHVPAAIVAIVFTPICLFISSLMGLMKKQELWLTRGVATAEVGLLFTVITLTSGSIWGKPTWGTYWTWDARLTTTLLLAILYTVYLIIYKSMDTGASRIKVASILGVLICIDAPIIYKSVTWWRTLHQPPSMLRPGGVSTMDSEMLLILATGITLSTLLALWMMAVRSGNIRLKQDIEDQALEKAQV